MTDTSYLVKGSDLTSVANAIRTMGGTSENLTFPTGFVSAVTNIDSTKWKRPADWPNLDAIDMTSFDGAYLTYDLRYVDYMPFVSVYYSIDTTLATVNLELGHLVNNSFVSDSVLATSSNNNGALKAELSSSNGNVQLIRLSTSAGNFSNFNLAKYDDFSYVEQPLGEIKARFPSVISTSAGNRGVASYFTKSVQIEFGTDHTMSYGLAGAINLQQIKFTGSGKITDASYLFYGTGIPTDFNFTSLDLSVCGGARAMVGGLSHFNVLDLRGTKLGETQLSSTISYLFYGPPTIKKLYMTGIDLGQNVFYNQTWLEDFLPGTIYPTSFSLSSTHLNYASLLAVIDALPTLDNTTATATLGSSNLTKLTAAEIAVATNKGWTVA